MTLPSHLKDLITQEAEAMTKIPQHIQKAIVEKAMQEISDKNIDNWSTWIKGYLSGATFLYNYLSKGQGAGAWVKFRDKPPEKDFCGFVRYNSAVGWIRDIMSTPLIAECAGYHDDLEYLDESALRSSELIRALEKLMKVRENLVLPFCVTYDSVAARTMAAAINEMYAIATKALKQKPSI